MSNSSSVTIEDYSEKAIAVFGDTKCIKDRLLELKGKYNPSLRGNGDEKRVGWIFPKTKKDEVQKLITDYKNNPQQEYVSHPIEKKVLKKSSGTESDFIFTKEMYLSLLTRIEKQETELLLCKKIIDKLTMNGNYGFAVDVKKPANTLLTTVVSTGGRELKEFSTVQTKKVINLKKEDNSDVSDVSDESSSDDENEIKKPMKNLLNIRK